VKSELGLRSIGVFIREKLWLENNLSQGRRVAQVIFEPKLFPYKYPKHFSNLIHYSHLPAYEDGTECSETSEYKIQPPGNCPEESIQHSEHGGSLKSCGEISLRITGNGTCTELRKSRRT
jgi:hypothetical protein